MSREGGVCGTVYVVSDETADHALYVELSLRLTLVAYPGV